jgi:hypothetical protein
MKIAPTNDTLQTSNVRRDKQQQQQLKMHNSSLTLTFCQLYGIRPREVIASFEMHNWRKSE